MNMISSKILSILIITILLLGSMLTGCGSIGNSGTGAIESKSVLDEKNEMIGNMYKTGLPIVKNKETFSILAIQAPAAPNWDEYAILKELEEKTNIHIDWEMVPSAGVGDKLKLIFATGDLPDAIFPYSNIKPPDDYNYGNQGLLLPLNDLIDKWAPNIKAMFTEFPVTKKAMTAPDGKIYSLPQYNPGESAQQIVNMGLVINKKWLTTLNLPEPKTTEDFYNVLKAFKEKDPNGNGKADEIPFSLLQSQLRYFYGAFGITDSQGIYISGDDKVSLAQATPGYKESIKWLNKLYKEKLLDQDLVSLNLKQQTVKGQADILGGYIAIHRSEVVGTKKAIEDYINILPLKGPQGFQLWPLNKTMPGVRPTSFVMSAKIKRPETLMRWIDLFYEKEFGFRMARVPEVTMIKRPDGKYEKKMPPDGVAEGDFYIQAGPVWFSTFFFHPDIYKNVIENQNVQIKEEQCKEYMPYVAKKGLPDIYFTSNDIVQKRDALLGDINAYTKQMQIKWITDGGIDEEWDEYVKKLKMMGMDEVVKIYTDVYNDYIKK